MKWLLRTKSGKSEANGRTYEDMIWWLDQCKYPNYDPDVFDKDNSKFIDHLEFMSEMAEIHKYDTEW